MYDHMSKEHLSWPSNHKITELTFDELHASSGVIDNRTGEEMTNRQFIDAWEEEIHQGRTYLNGHLSPEAVAHNALVRNKKLPHHQRIVAVMSHRPPLVPEDKPINWQPPRDELHT